VKRHLTYANVMATLGVFLALGGVSYAAIKLPKNSVGAKQIKSGAVGSSEVANNSLKAGDFKSSSLPKGPKGATGDRGPAAVKYWAQVSGGATPTVLNSSGGVTVSRNPANLAATVTFPANISKCAVLLTHSGGPSLVTLRTITRPTGASVDLWSSQSDGMGGVTTTSSAFDIAVFC
jgi:hypothetical protein